jgi:hypothetical protein
MEQVKTARELGLGEPKRGYEWEAGETPPGDSAPGRWIVKKRARDWAVLFHSDKGVTYIIHTFSPTEEGERAARSMALKLVDIAWGRNFKSEKAKAQKGNISDKDKNSHPT